jgi:vancomycin resistance protein YoaR
LLILATLAVWLAALAGIAGILAYQYNYEGRVFEGVSVRGIDLSGLRLAEAEARLQIAFDPYPLMPIAVRYGDRTWNLTAEDLGVNFDAASAAQAAYRVGRDAPSGAPVSALADVSREVLLARLAQVQSNLQEQLAVYRFGHEVLAEETVDRTAGLLWLQERAREIDRPVVEASLRVDGMDVAATRSTPGYALDVTGSLQALYNTLLDNQGGVVELAVNQTTPLLADVSQAEVFVRQVFNGPITLIAPDPDLDASAPPPSYTISAEQLAPLVSLQTLPQIDGSLELKAALDVQPLRDEVLSWALELRREPREGRLDFDPKTGQVNVVTPSQIGRELDVDATMAALYQAALSPERTAELPLRLIEPAINMHRIPEMGIKEVVAKGTTSFKGSSADRVHNIKTGAAAMQGIVIPPDGVFSFNEAVGSVDAEHGYRDSLIIWGDRTAVGIGGGICQVSTTVFRAAYYGGLPIEERYNHGYVVGWYGQPGLDATIYTPTVDFKFRNNTAHYLMIESEIDEAKGTLTFIFYGTKPDWTVEVTGPQISNEAPPGKPVYQEDVSLASGEIKQVEWSNKGLEVVWKRVIKDAQGQVISSEDLKSKYSPWSAYYLVGPGTPIPEGADFRPASTPQAGG